jgi:hypothetical protein
MSEAAAPTTYRKSWEAPYELRFVDGVRLNGGQVNDLARMKVDCGGDIRKAFEMFRLKYKIVQHGCCSERWV